MPRLKIDLRMAMIRPSREVGRRARASLSGAERDSGAHGRRYPIEERIDVHKFLIA